MSYRASHAISSRSTISDLFCKRFHVNSLLGILRILGVISSLDILAWEVRFISKYCQSQRHTQGKFGSDDHFHFIERSEVGICPRNPIPIEAISYAQELQSKVSIPYHSQSICTHGTSTVSLRASKSAASKPKSRMCRESR
jgi:hypothetical protein